MQDEEKKVRKAVADMNAGVAAFETVLAGLASHQESLGKGVAIMPRDLAAMMEKAKSAVATAKGGLDVLNAILPPAEDADEPPAKPVAEPQPSVAAPAANPQPTSTAAPAEAPEPSIPEVESAETTKVPDETVHVPE